MTAVANSNPVRGSILHKLSLVLLICLLLGYNCEAMGRKAEKAALLSLERYWGLQTTINWSSIIDRSHCKWDGVTCTQEGFVTGISLRFYNLAKPIPLEICSFKNITNIDLSSNKIPGSFPTVLFSCSSLEFLDLSYNSFVGSLPLNIHLLSKTIAHLNLESNSLSSSIPSSICQLSSLQVLKLSFNPFDSHRIDPQFGNLTNLEELSMGNMNIVGEIPDTITKLTRLRTLDLSCNTLNGTIPTGIWSMQNLEFLDLHSNSLSGRIPDDFCKLKNLSQLRTLDLSSNTLKGTIPSGIWRMQNLSLILLNGNLLSGPLPENVTQLQLASIFLDFSSNQLTGKIPSPFEMSRFGSSFRANPGLCSSNHFGNLPPCTKFRLTIFVIILMVFGSAIFICTGLIGLTKIKAFSSKEKDDAPSPQWKLTAFHAIDYDIQDIVCSLIDANLVGSGGSGKVYKICLGDENSELIAVKQIWSSNGVQEHDVLEKQFQAEIEILGSIRHANIVKLLGYISSSESKLLIYEYMENGSLYEWLHQKDEPTTSTSRQLLNWPTRMSIAIDAARGLCYMHHGCSPAIAHRDVKSSNILLDPEFKAKVADFGLARALLKAGEPESVSAVVGSFGYIAPEFGSSRKMNEKVDVYSFGVVLLELVTGRCANGGGGYENLAQWAWRQFHQDESIHLTNVIDADIRDPAYSREVQLVFKLGLICTGTNPSSRPSMKQVLQVLQR
ncbi:leucine-rich repeat receptor-like kinase protein CLV1a [Triticum dicoccoides]|uniref:leucine-rich repeat receptor-like kinase protein CLV1a n=1 Tax=Triticum dicoccoides TaxID=85692 RepID=UPI001891402E|nr:leucine-rich repeat receptor-like kinase protein CLV1a [Triticum dicoccoides]